MAADVVMPQMGESIFEGTITKWLKKPGDKVERDEPLFEISTDKVDAEIPSPTAGVLKDIKVKEGQTVPINTVVATIDGAGAAAAAPAQTPAAAPAAKAEPPKPAAAAPAATPPPQARTGSCSHAAGRPRCIRVSKRRRAHSQFTAGSPHGQGTRNRPWRSSRQRRRRAHHQGRHRIRHRGRRSHNSIYRRAAFRCGCRVFRAPISACALTACGNAPASGLASSHRRPRRTSSARHTVHSGAAIGCPT